MSIFDNLISSIFQKLFYSTCDRENFLSFIPNFKNFHLLLEQLLSKLGLLLDWLCIVEIFPSIVKVLTLENIILLNPFMIFLEQSNITQNKSETEVLCIRNMYNKLKQFWKSTSQTKAVTKEVLYKKE